MIPQLDSTLTNGRSAATPVPGDAIRQLSTPGCCHDEHEIEAVLDVLPNSDLDIGEKLSEMEERLAKEDRSRRA